MTHLRRLRPIIVFNHIIHLLLKMPACYPGADMPGHSLRLCSAGQLQGKFIESAKSA